MTGKVVLIGAGPGDPELITLKAIRFLREADVILTDRLVSEQILEEHANPEAEVLLVGKEGCNNQKSFSQKEIDQLLIQYAMEGKLVVRLKGGDVAFFSNVLNELEILRRFDIPYEIVPGITAASGASAYAGMPLTARNHARGVRFLTFSKKHHLDIDNWDDLAATSDTLVFYMAGEAWYDLATLLLKHGIEDDKQLAIVEQATTPYQKVHTFSFAQLRYDRPEHTFVSPSLIVVGNVVHLHEKFQWVNNETQYGQYFQSADNCKSIRKISSNTVVL
ncbi:MULTISPECIES: uroporphyrinogen-III C-methyltransferase [Chitinophagaceae]